MFRKNGKNIMHGWKYDKKNISIFILLTLYSKQKKIVSMNHITNVQRQKSSMIILKEWIVQKIVCRNLSLHQIQIKLSYVKMKSKNFVHYGIFITFGSLTQKDKNVQTPVQSWSIQENWIIGNRTGLKIAQTLFYISDLHHL